MHHNALPEPCLRFWLVWQRNRLTRDRPSCLTARYRRCSSALIDQPPLPPNFDYESALLDCAQGDRAALQQIYARKASQLLGIALRMVRRHDLADEVLQDAFLQIWQATMFDRSVARWAAGFLASSAIVRWMRCGKPPVKWLWMNR